MLNGVIISLDFAQVLEKISIFAQRFGEAFSAGRLGRQNIKPTFYISSDMSKRISYRFKDAMSNFEESLQKTTYKGKECTVAQARAMKSAETRRKKREEEKAAKSDSKYDRHSVLPSLHQYCKQIRSSARVLKSIRAFHHNGEGQWHSKYKEFLRMFPEIARNLGLYVKQYDEIIKTEENMGKALKKNRSDKSCFAYVDKFGYQMLDLLEMAEKLFKSVSRSGVMDMPGWKDHEIVKGATDGRRVGLKKIQGEILRINNKVKSSLVLLAKQAKESYRDLSEHII